MSDFLCYALTDGDILGRIACARRLGCGLVVHSERDARRGEQIADQHRLPRWRSAFLRAR